MKRIRGIVGFILILAMLGGTWSPMASVDAASTVKIVYKSKTKTYTKKKTAFYVNGKKKSIKKTPIFLKEGSYMGPAATLFKSSALKVTYKASSDHKTLVLTYNNHVLRMTSGKTAVTIDGKADELGTAPFYAKYKSSKQTTWIVPIKSVCTRLGIGYALASNGRIQLSGTANNSSAKAPVVATPQSVSGDKDIVTVVLDAGHGGSDSGCSMYNIAEKNLNLAVVLAAKKRFDKDERFKVYYTRTLDTFPSLTSRPKLANDVKAEIFISIHINEGSPSSKTATGTETWYSEKRNAATAIGNLNSKDLANYIHNSMLKATGFPNRGLVKDYRNLCVLRETKMPACLVEVGFISKKAEALAMNNATNKDRYGDALYNGLVNYLKTKGRIK